MYTIMSNFGQTGMDLRSLNMESGYKCMNGQQKGGVSLNLNSTDQHESSYLNQRGNDYLTPTSPVTPVLPAFPASFGTQNKQQPRLPRADSGIETDAPTSRSPLSSDSTTYPRSSTLYEYIDHTDVNVQEIHGSHDVTMNQGQSFSSGSTGTRASTQPLYTPTTTESVDGLHGGTGHRVNPTYDALDKSTTQLYAQMCHCKQQSSALKQLRYLWCAFIFLIVIAIFLLGVIAYMFFNRIPNLQSHLQVQGDRLTMLETTYAEFINQSTASHVQLTSKDKSTSATVSAGLSDMFVQLNSSVTAFNTQLQQVNTSLQEQIYNINLKPDPLQNVSSVTNLNACSYGSFASAVALPAGNNTTSWQPNRSDLQDYLLMSASCEVENGDQQSLEAKKISSDKVQYRCRCDGSKDVTTLRLCRIHFVKCPRLLILALKRVPDSHWIQTTMNNP